MHTFVQIQVIPPLHSGDVAEPRTVFKDCQDLMNVSHVPHMRDLMALNDGNPLLSIEVTLFGVQKECACPACD